MTNTVLALLSISLALVLGGQSLTKNQRQLNAWGKAISTIAIIPLTLSLILVCNPQLSVETWAYVAFFLVFIVSSFGISLCINKRI